MESFKSIIEEELLRTIGIGAWSLPRYFAKPIFLEKTLLDLVAKRRVIEDFFDGVITIAQKALKNSDEEIIRILFSEAPAGLDVEYHKNLPPSCWNKPIIYRTDQSISGKIYEVQAPGSGWGDLYLYAIVLKRLGFEVPKMYLDFPLLYAENIINATKKSHPCVFHMLDAASVPYSMRYLQYITSKYMSYWGLSNNVKMNNIDCLISHSVTSSVTSNYFKTYMHMALEGKLVFSTPPNLIFDEKAIYVLPFYKKTKDFFSEEIRSIFPYTAIIENGGFFDENGEFVLIDDFVNRKPHERKYYLKYGGPDTDRNWGSRSVFRLTENDCKKLLSQADILTRKGEVWLIQKDVSKNILDVYSQDIENILHDKNHIKLSGYYGTDRLFGVKIMARHHFKVHGQSDTLVGLGV